MPSTPPSSSTKASPTPSRAARGSSAFVKTLGKTQNVVILTFFTTLILYSAISSTIYSAMSFNPEDEIQSQQMAETAVILAALSTTIMPVQQPAQAPVIDSKAAILAAVGMNETIAEFKNQIAQAVQEALSQTTAAAATVATASVPAVSTKNAPPSPALEKKSLMEQLAELDSLSPPSCPEGLVRVNDTHIPESHDVSKHRIPKIIFQTSRSRCITPNLYKQTMKWRRALPGWSYYFFDDDAVMRLLHEDFPEFPHMKLLTTACIEYGTIKADLWRYAAVWKYGGLYSDLDSVPGRNFTSTTILPTDDSFFVVEYYYLLSQYFLAASPRHPLMYYTLQKALFNLLNAKDTGKFNAAMQTGPHALHAGFQFFMKDNHIEIQGAKQKPVKEAATYVGSNNRTVRVIGEGYKKSNEFVVRESVKRGPKVSDYKLMNMTHNQDDFKHPTRKSCLTSILQQGLVLR